MECLRKKKGKGDRTQVYLKKNNKARNSVKKFTIETVRGSRGGCCSPRTLTNSRNKEKTNLGATSKSQAKICVFCTQGRSRERKNSHSATEEGAVSSLEMG